MLVNNNRETLLKELRAYWIKNSVPNISDTNAHFLRDLVIISWAKNILEIWTANWFSTIHLWIEAEKNNGQVMSIDFSKPSHLLAQDNILKAKLENTITLIFGDALSIIPSLDSQFDFVFIDWMMKSSLNFLLLVWEKTSVGWIIIIDDVIKFKDKMVWLDNFLKKNNIPHNIIPLDINDWIMMIIKPDCKLI